MVRNYIACIYQYVIKQSRMLDVSVNIISINNINSNSQLLLV